MIYNKIGNQKKYPFVLPDLPFDKNAFAPDISAETFEYHHDKHHNAYVNNLNNLIKDNPEYNKIDLESIMGLSDKKNDFQVFNNASQIWNHSFFWNSIKPQGGGAPQGEIANRIEKQYGSYNQFVELFKKASISQFGSGWAWLIYSLDKKMFEILGTPDAWTPMKYKSSYFPLLVCDVWEHAYYIDYRNRRPDYITTFIDKMINWDFVEKNLNTALKLK